MVIRNVKRLEVFPDGENRMVVEVVTEDGDWFLASCSKTGQPKGYEGMKRIYEKAKKEREKEQDTASE